MIIGWQRRWQFLMPPNGVQTFLQNVTFVFVVLNPMDTRWRVQIRKYSSPCGLWPSYRRSAPKPSTKCCLRVWTVSEREQILGLAPVFFDGAYSLLFWRFWWSFVIVKNHSDLIYNFLLKYVCRILI